MKNVFRCDGYLWNDNRVWFHALVRASKLKNDTLTTRLPIRVTLLEQILFELGRVFKLQPYLLILYRAMFALAYYGLLRVGKITDSNHVIRAKNVFQAQNKNRIKFILYTLKTHDKGSIP